VVVPGTTTVLSIMQCQVLGTVVLPNQCGRVLVLQYSGTPVQVLEHYVVQKHCSTTSSLYSLYMSLCPNKSVGSLQ
jgi:hypothetical protein